MLNGKVMKIKMRQCLTIFSRLHGNSCFIRHYHYLSRLFINQTKPQPADSQFTCTSHKLMLYNGIMYQEHSGVYHLLPVGQRALDKLISLVDKAMCKIGAQKVTMPCLNTGALWKKSGRWDMMGKELFRLTDRNHSDLCLGPTHEESVTSLVASQCPLPSRTLPLLLYQINTKFRDEMLPKYGLLRGREFIMKDLYTFDRDETSARHTYSRVCAAYRHILEALQLPYTQVEAATGNIGGTYSHEFHLPSYVGEDKLLLCHRCGAGYNLEVIEDPTKEDHYCQTPECNTKLHHTAGIEIGHTFLLGTIFSSPFHAEYKDHNGSLRLLEMGCYGIGMSRLLQASIQVLSPANQIRWPYRIAPYKVCIIPQKEGYKSEEFMSISLEVASELEKLPDLYSDVLIDDRTEMTVGKRLYEARRRGWPYVIVVNKMALDTSLRHYEMVDVYNDKTTHVSLDQILDVLISRSSHTDTPTDTDTHRHTDADSCTGKVVHDKM